MGCQSFLNCQLYLLAITVATVAGVCTTPPSLTHATRAPTTDLAVGAEVVYTCIEGYEFVTEDTNIYTIACLASNTWESISDCEKINCPVLPVDATVQPTDNKYGAVVLMSCTGIADYRIPEVEVGLDLTVTCQANKTWDFWDSNKYTDGCIPIQCVYPMDPNSVGQNLVVTVGAQVEYTCNTGYFFNDDSTAKFFECNANGEWESDTILGVTRTDWTCIPKECNELITTYNLTNVVVDPPTHFVGDEVLVACKAGHEFNDSSIEKHVTCNGNETWNLVPFNCEAKLCPEVINMSLVDISTFDNWYPTVVNYTCHDGLFFPDGSSWRVAECNQYGKWSNSIPQCGDAKSIETNFVKQEFAADNASTLGLVSMSIIIVILVAIVALDAVTFGMQLGFLKTNLVSRFDCLKPEEDDLESLDGDELMRSSTISLGHGRITPAASTVDLQYGEKSKQSQLNTLEDVEALNEELREVEIVGKKNLIPRTRLQSAKSSIQRAMKKATGIRQMTTIRKNAFASTGLPLGAENYGKIVEMRPPSPTKDDGEDSDESEYTDDDSEEEEVRTV